MFTTTHFQSSCSSANPTYTLRPTCPPVTLNLIRNVGTPLRIPAVYATSTPTVAPPRCATGKPRRGRRSLLPPEQREQTRRLKKQNMERRRRACISDKINALHNLALSIVGLDVDQQTQVQSQQLNQQHRLEKADILTTCYKVFEGIAKIAKEKPELQMRLRQLRFKDRHHQPTDNVCLFPDETTQSSSCSDGTVSVVSAPDGSIRRNSRIKETPCRFSHIPPGNTSELNKPPITILMAGKPHCRKSSSTVDSGIYSSPDESMRSECAERLSSPASRNRLQAQQPRIRLPMNNSLTPHISPLRSWTVIHEGSVSSKRKIHESVASSSNSVHRLESTRTSSDSVWRPYL
ncbi:hypothetical protein CRM22_009210 [Opisthorchis felineus]|uniref:BHLH domain-containing protein n=2 Tax=Opisthorchis felineus TaxID=147828 RepID=A0A4S2L8L2_OPIFE|nr:hypothetical protein CRM22_009210 [Opisthorchis felineus]